MFLQHYLQIFSLFDIYLLIRWFLIKAETKCPFKPCPSQTQNSLTPCGRAVSMMAISWFIFVCLPLVPALVLVTACILNVFWMGISFFFLLSYIVAEREVIEVSTLSQIYFIFYLLFADQLTIWEAWTCRVWFPPENLGQNAPVCFLFGCPCYPKYLDFYLPSPYYFPNLGWTESC